jgi:hypothetical protein
VHEDAGVENQHSARSPAPAVAFRSHKETRDEFLSLVSHTSHGSRSVGLARVLGWVPSLKYRISARYRTLGAQSVDSCGPNRHRYPAQRLALT